MNRIIIIGNGFDKAHGLKTGYEDFMDWYWNLVLGKIYKVYFDKCCMEQMLNEYTDSFINLSIETLDRDKRRNDNTFEFNREISVFRNVRSLIDFYNDKFANMEAKLSFKNLFFESICNRYNLMNWVDIENEYYRELKLLLKESDPVIRSHKVKKLNADFEGVKNLLNDYLNLILEGFDKRPIHSIEDAFVSTIRLRDISLAHVDQYLAYVVNRYREVVSAEVEKGSFLKGDELSLGLDVRMKLTARRMLDSDVFVDLIPKPEETLVLNFNYTCLAEDLYTSYDGMRFKVINIHGELGHRANPIIFGYGDDLDVGYQEIENLNDNDFLENMKSIQYNLTNNYHWLLEFIQSAPFQVCVMGHSCGTSDRTLLNTIFEHVNNVSLKVYYHQKSRGEDDYTELVKNISRNFNDKVRMRDVVVNKSYCVPLVP